MKTTRIPAQITTIEDTVAGKLTLRQLILLIIPIILSMMMYIFIPKYFNFSTPKIIISSFLIIISSVASINTKNRLIIDWIVILIKYIFRPKYFVYERSSITFKDKLKMNLINNKNHENIKNKIEEKTISTIFSYGKISLNPKFSISFKPVKKGGIKVAIYKIS